MVKTKWYTFIKIMYVDIYVLQSLASWQVKEQPAKIKEAGQELLEDFKETKAKVKEKMGEIVEVRPSFSVL